MSTIHDTADLGRTIASVRSVWGSLKQVWAAVQERHERARLRTALDDLNDHELRDIGITREEIDYVAMNRAIDPRGVRSTGPINV